MTRGGRYGDPATLAQPGPEPSIASSSTRTTTAVWPGRSHRACAAIEDLSAALDRRPPRKRYRLINFATAAPPSNCPTNQPCPLWQRQEVHEVPSPPPETFFPPPRSPARGQRDASAASLRTSQRPASQIAGELLVHFSLRRVGGGRASASPDSCPGFFAATTPSDLRITCAGESISPLDIAACTVHAPWGRAVASQNR